MIDKKILDGEYEKLKIMQDEAIDKLVSLLKGFKNGHADFDEIDDEYRDLGSYVDAMVMLDQLNRHFEPEDEQEVMACFGNYKPEHQCRLCDDDVKCKRKTFDKYTKGGQNG